MYYCWKEKDMRPSDFYNISDGELAIIRAFYEKELEEKYERNKALKKAGVMCPAML